VVSPAHAFAAFAGSGNWEHEILFSFSRRACDAGSWDGRFHLSRIA
jgi:hypothetical protein